MWQHNFIAVDWGTTNRRAWLVDEAGNIAADFADGLGLMAVPPAGFETAVADIRDRLGNHPMLLAGMVGSDKGWQKTPYLNCPADAKMLADAILWVEPFRTGIVPGVCQLEGRADVMRGEEVQALGALAGTSTSLNAYLCHPGTHTKWIRLHEGKIGSFQTVMTGEIFNLLKTKSILSAQMHSGVTAGDAFEAGLNDIKEGTALMAALFSVRARYLLEQTDVDGASYASGLLIGADVQAGLAHARKDETIVIVGRSDLCELYESAIAHAGFACKIIDGDQAFLGGIKSIVDQFTEGPFH